MGCFVRIDGLASRADLNGTEGVVMSYDATKGRFGVRPHTEPAPLALKPTNLTVTAAKSTPTRFTEPLDIVHGHLRIRALRDPDGWAARNLAPGRQLHEIVEDFMAEPLAAPHTHGMPNTLGHLTGIRTI